MKILLADDHAMVRVGMKLLLGRVFDGAIVIEAQDYAQTFGLCQAHQGLDLILLDRMMPGMNGLESIIGLCQVAGQTPVIVMSAYEDPGFILQCLDKGVRGYIPKASDEQLIVSAIRLVVDGGVYLPPALLGLYRETRASYQRPPTLVDSADVITKSEGLTPRQQDVLRLLAQGKSNKRIAQALGISDATVKTHVNAIFQVLNVSNRTEAVHVATIQGLL